MSRRELKLYPLRKPVKGLPNQFKSPTKGLLSYGHVPRLSGFLQRTRTKLGLDKTPPSAYQFKDAVKDIQEIFKVFNLDAKFGWDWKKKRFKF
ncbi:MAG: hdrC-like protein [Candidatus Methanomethylicota archaeon]|uniref:HdrC-like protein n=1 Tax=Thermoproteota archaeon TaxID=2056631 RepID=A0A497ETW8_9CREN|nr:MAG: hdrC-like protein [Candidatus Verstraetearchaeota archaeon]